MSSLTLRRDFAASPGHVWACLTEPETLASWFWPHSLAATVEAEVQAEGRYRIASATTGMAVSGRYLEVDAPTRLAFTWQWDGEPAETVVQIELTAAPDGACGLTLTQDGFADERSRDDHIEGWNDCLDRLPTVQVD